MAIFKWITVGVLICMSFIPLTHEEIHRAKVNSVKYPAKTADYVADFNQPKPDIVGLDKTREELSTVNMLESRYETWCFSIFGAILVGLSGIFPLLVIPMEAGPSLKHGAAASRLKLLLSFAVGGLLGDVFLHLLPEAWAHMDHDNGHDAHTKLGLWVIAGLLSFLIIEKMFAKEDEFERLEDECTEAEVEQYHELEHDHDTVKKNNNTDCVAHRTRHWTNKNINDKEHIYNVCKNIKNGRTNAVHSDSETHIHKVEEKAKESSIKVSGYLNLAANVIDNFTHGLAVAGGFLISNKVGFITTLAILLHEIPHEVGDFAILLRSGFDRWKAAKAQLLTATGGMVGALTALTADSAQAAGDRTAWILPFTSGGFLYIALVTVVPDLLKEKHPKESTKQVTCLLAGILAMYLVSLVH